MGLEVVITLQNDDGPPVSSLLEVWRQVIPRGVAFGEALFRSGEVGHMLEHKLPVWQVIDNLQYLLREADY